MTSVVAAFVMAVRAVLSMVGAVAALAAMMAVDAILPVVGAVSAFSSVVAMDAILTSRAGCRTGETQSRQSGRRKTQLQ